MHIIVRLEGGLGDVLLGNRFIPAIKEKYPDAVFTAYIDSEGKTFQKESMEVLYPSYYKEIIVIPHKKYDKFVIDCQFGKDTTYKGALENVPDEYVAAMQKGDKFYDLHIDSLKWIDYDFDWLRYYRYFPRPEMPAIVTDEKYVVFHLVSNTKNDHGLEPYYITKLVLETANYMPCKVISTPDVRYFYKELENKPNIQVIDTKLKEAFELISAAQCMVSIDSGFKYVGYGYSVPTLCMSRQVHAPMQPFLSHQLRWMPFPETCFPLNYDYGILASLVDRICKNKAHVLVPNVTNFNNQMVRRVFKVDEVNSKLYGSSS